MCWTIMSYQNGFIVSWHRFYKHLDLYWRNEHNSYNSYHFNCHFDNVGRECYLILYVTPKPQTVSWSGRRTMCGYYWEKSLVYSLFSAKVSWSVMYMIQKGESIFAWFWGSTVVQFAALPLHRSRVPGSILGSG